MTNLTKIDTGYQLSLSLVPSKFEEAPFIYTNPPLVVTEEFEDEFREAFANVEGLELAEKDYPELAANLSEYISAQAEAGNVFPIGFIKMPDSTIVDVQHDHELIRVMNKNGEVDYNYNTCRLEEGGTHLYTLTVTL